MRQHRPERRSRWRVRMNSARRAGSVPSSPVLGPVHCVQHKQKMSG